MKKKITTLLLFVIAVSMLFCACNANTPARTVYPYDTTNGYYNGNPNDNGYNYGTGIDRYNNTYNDTNNYGNGVTNAPYYGYGADM